MKENDLDSTALVHAEDFSRQGHSQELLACTIRAFPRTLCYVAEQGNHMLSYIVWAQKSGFRPQAVLELEQIAIHPDEQIKVLASHS